LFLRASIAWHALAFVSLIAMPARWPWALGAMLANQALLTLLGLWPRSTWLGPNLTRLPAASAARNEIALTIDDGPDPLVTPKVLDILARHAATATFFCIGEKAEQHADLCRDIVRAGHSIENHTQHHAWHFALSGTAAYAREIAHAQEVISRITGRAPRFFRAPAGLRNPLLDPVLHRLGLRLAAWTRRGFDTLTGDPDLIRRRLLPAVRAGGILLLHDGRVARTTAGTPVIVEVLPTLLEAANSAGLRWVTLPQALDGGSA
jgi:peptidoglycan/xylan/chitin deacetylase (PgdA/CDA1 family)